MLTEIDSIIMLHVSQRKENKMIKLLTYQKGYGQFSLSPFCVKAALLLKASGLDWERQDLPDPRKMPNAKLPCIDVAGKIIHDSEGIRAYLETQGCDFDAGLTDDQRAFSRAIVRMAEEHMYFHIVMDRWGNDDVWAYIRAEYFNSIPALIRRPVTFLIRRDTMAGLRAQGIGRMSEQERLDRIDLDLAALRQMLKAQDYLFGDNPTAADYSVGPMISNMMVCPYETMLSRHINADPVLTAYADRVSKDLK
jgi:glutathione S-transferase